MFSNFADFDIVDTEISWEYPGWRLFISFEQQNPINREVMVWVLRDF
jgi:hypothetical protein